MIVFPMTMLLLRHFVRVARSTFDSTYILWGGLLRTHVELSGPTNTAHVPEMICK